MSNIQQRTSTNPVEMVEEPFQPQQSKYSAERLMMMLDKEKLEALEEEFNEHPDGIELHNFVWLMKCAMTVAPEERAELVLGLYYLFQEIDINGDEHMEWSEFTQYIIDAVMSQQAKDRNEEKELTVAEIMELAQSHKSRRYQMSKQIDRSLHVGIIRKMKYFNNLEYIAVSETNGQQVKLYNLQSEVKVALLPIFSFQAFVLDFAYCEKRYQFLVSGSDKRMYLFEKEGHGFRQVGQPIATEFNNYGVWYFEDHDVWMTSSDDFNLRFWDPKTLNNILTLAGHTKTVMDAIEIKKPYCIATAALDGKIYLWKLGKILEPQSQKSGKAKPFGELSGKHARVRALDYSPDYAGYILSIGYEREIHVWSPEVSISKCYAGKLEGHNCPVVQCKFFRGRPICVSVDERGNVRIWDVRQLLCLQIIPNERGKIEVTGLVTITKYDRFIVSGRRLLWYELLKESALKTINQDITPISADFNAYYLQFVVVTKYDVRIYDSFTGKLKKIYTEVQDVLSESELSAFCLDHRHRIIILGDNSGGIRAYNFSNGALMRTIEGHQDKKMDNLADYKPKKKFQMSRNPVTMSKSYAALLNQDNKERPKSHRKQEKKYKDDSSLEISDLKYCDDDKLLISVCWDSTIRIYDQNSSEESPLLRVMSGGHMGSDITCVTFSSHLCLIASGSSNGIVSVWDFEMGKLEASCFGHKKSILAIEFVNPYSLMVTSASDGTFCVWPVRPHPGGMRYHCIARIVNYSWNINKDIKCNITSIQNFVIVDSGIERYCKKAHFRQRRVQDNRKDRMKDERSKSIYDPLSPTPRVTILLHSDDESSEQTHDYIEGDSEYEWVEDNNTNIVEELDIEEIKRRAYSFVGDSKGYIKIWQLKDIIADNRVLYVERSMKDKPSYNPRRKDEKNAESDVKFWRKESEKVPIPSRISHEDYLVREWKAHTQPITSIKKINEPKGIVSCASDKMVKIWSFEGESWGVINLLSTEPPKKWFFPFDWESKRQDDIQKVIEVMNLIDEKMDFDPNSLAQTNRRVQAQPQIIKRTKMRKPQKLQLYDERPNTQQRAQEMFIRNLKDDDDDDISYESTTENKPKYIGPALKLQRKLDEYDEKKNREERDGRRGVKEVRASFKRPQRLRDLDPEDMIKFSKPSSRSEKSKASMTTRKLPVLGNIDKQGKRNMGKSQSTTVLTTNRAKKKQKELDTFLTTIKEKQKRRPLLGYGSSQVPVNRIYMERLGSEINTFKKSGSQQILYRKLLYQPGDIKFRSGESVKMMERAVNSYTYRQISQISPYNEDLDTLRKRNETFKQFNDQLHRKAFRSSESSLKKYFSELK